MTIWPLLLAAAQPAVGEKGDYAGWYQCTVVERETLIRSKEPIDILATAVMSACSSFERAAVAKLMREAPVNRDVFETRRLVSSLVAEVREQMRGTVIEFFVRKRLPPG